MTDAELGRLLETLNNGRPEEIIIRPISNNVWWGYVWQTPTEGLSGPSIHDRHFEFYFVKALDGKFGAAVMLGGPEEFHWYVSPDYRGKRLLVRPMKKTILPHVFHFHQDWPALGGSVDKKIRFAEQSRKLALRVGFKKVREKDGKVFYSIRRRGVAIKFKLPRRLQVDCGDIEAFEHSYKNHIRGLRMLADRAKVQFRGEIAAKKVEGLEVSILESESLLFDMVDGLRRRQKQPK